MDEWNLQMQQRQVGLSKAAIEGHVFTHWQFGVEACACLCFEI